MPSTGKKELRILILEDVASDVVLINHELRRSGMLFKSKRVDTKSAFLYELQHHPPDIILSDHGLPEFDGFAALAIAHERCPDVPFIFVTGALGEEKAIESFRKGASDCVLKRNLSTKLVPALQRTIHEAAERARRNSVELVRRDNEARLRQLIEGIRDYAIFMVDPEGRIASWNTGAQLVHGFSTAEILGKNLSVLYSPEESGTAGATQALRLARTDGRFEEEGWRARRDGPPFWASVFITALRDENRTLRGFAHVTRDFSAQKNMAETLQRSEASRRAILDASLDAVVFTDQAGTLTEWNRAAEKMFGHSRLDALGKDMAKLILPPVQGKYHHRRIAAQFKTGPSRGRGRRLEFTALRADGTVSPIEIATTPVPNLVPPTFVSVIRDLASRKEFEACLRKSEERYRMLVENAEDYAIYMLDPEGCISTWNIGAERIEGYTADEIIGRHFSILYPEEDIACGRPAQVLKIAIEKGQHREEGWRVRKDRSRYWTSIVIAALRNEAGELCGFSKIHRDITKRKQAEEEIRRLNEELENRVLERTAQLEVANRELEAFSFSVSHDLRAPLRHINGFVEMLLSREGSQLAEADLRIIQTISQSAAHMGRLIDDLLAFSRMGRTEMRAIPIDLDALVRSLIHDSEPDTVGRTIDWSIGPLGEVRGDPTLLRQVFVNLIGNALKYTRPRTDAKIEISRIDASNEIIISIKDNGVGFDMRYVDKLFGVFQRLHLSADFEGTGIGLANVRRVITRHGGRTWAEGKTNQGAAFFFSLPKTNGGPHDQMQIHHGD